MVIYPIWLYNKWPRGLFSRSFPIYNDLQTSISNMASSNIAIICRNGSEPFERTLLTVLTKCLYHPSLSSRHSLHFPPFSFIYLLPPSFSFIHLPLFAFINHLRSFIFIHLHSNSFISSYFHLHSPSSTSSTSSSLHPRSSDPISLLLPSISISVDPPSSTRSTFISLH